MYTMHYSKIAYVSDICNTVEESNIAYITVNGTYEMN